MYAVNKEKQKRKWWKRIGGRYELHIEACGSFY